MAISVASLTSSFASLSFSSQISQKRCVLSCLTHSKPVSLSRSFKIPTIVVSAKKIDEAEPEGTEEFGDLEELEEVLELPEPPKPVFESREELLKLVKSRLPGGFAAQPIYGTGRRKSASARVILQEGSGRVIINYRDAREYLQGNPLWIEYVKTPLLVLGYEASYDVFVKVQGGGLSGQAQAISLGIARALLKLSEGHRQPLRAEGLLTRDARVVERKKVGLHKARKRPQYSKR